MHFPIVRLLAVSPRTAEPRAHAYHIPTIPKPLNNNALNRRIYGYLIRRCGGARADVSCEHALRGLGAVRRFDCSSANLNRRGGGAAYQPRRRTAKKFLKWHF